MLVSHNDTKEGIAHDRLESQPFKGRGGRTGVDGTFVQKLNPTAPKINEKGMRN